MRRRSCDGQILIMRQFTVATKRNGDDSSVMTNNINDEPILRPVFPTTLFLIFGWRKLRDFSGTVSQMVQLGVPMPMLAAGVATFMELPVGSRSPWARSRVLRLTFVFVHAGNRVYWASLLDDCRCGLR